MYTRHHINILKKRVEESRRFIQTITGPRQVGKTTLVEQLLEEVNIPYHFCTADSIIQADNSWIEQQWETARLKHKKSQTEKFLFIIDEIQKVPNWSESIKKQWDLDTHNHLPLQLILLGSSRLLLQHGLTESLAGRYEIIQMGHWTFKEMNSAFGLNPEQFAWFGGYPGSADLINDEKRWKDYINNSLIESTISKDILLLTKIVKPALLRKLFELGCLYSGQILSFTKILGQLHDAGNTTTLSHYLRLLETAGLLTGLEKYSENIIRKRASSPKFQVYNTALLSAQHLESFSEISEKPKEWGRIVESAIGAHLINYSITEGFKVYYWRDGNNEVDFILQYNDKIIGLEIKSSLGNKTAGMANFKKKFNPHKILLIGEQGLPWQDFLTINPIELF